MRSIINKGKPNRGNQLILGLALVVLMIFSTVGFAFGNRDSENIEKTEYNDIEFIQDNSGSWEFMIDGNQFLTEYNPEEVKEINIPGFFTLNQYIDKPLYVIGEYQSANYEIARNIERFTLRTRPACLDNNCEQDYPIKNCSIDNIISIQEPEEGEVETIYLEDKCFFIVADIQNHTRYIDAFLFKILGVN